MTRALVAVVTLASCGRFGFDAIGPASDDATTTSPGDGGAGSNLGPILGDAGLPSGLIAWYPFEDNSFVDVISGQAGACFSQTCPTVVPGHIGNALAFDAATCLTMPDDGRFELATLSIALWVEPTGASATTQLGKLGNSSNGSQTWQLANDMGGEQLMILDPSTHAVVPVTASEPGFSGWHFIVATISNVSVALYVDGLLANRIAAVGLQYQASPLTIGCEDNAGVANAYQGFIDDVQVYDRALSSTEITALATR